jgi:predicted SAM-dependent methyltransferase
LLHQRYKNLAFWGISKAAFPNYLLRKYLMGAQANGSRHLHLGCGTKYLPGFVNIDGNFLNRIDLWLDVRNGLPFGANSVDSIYSTHMFEHFYADELEKLLRDCSRVLKPGGGIRLIVPNLESAIAAYERNQVKWFDPFPHNFDSVGGRFSNFVFCDGQHRAAFDYSHMEEVLRRAGFNAVERSGEGRSRLYGERVPPYEPGDLQDLPHSLYVEGFK